LFFFSQISLEKFALRIINNEINSVHQEMNDIHKFLRLEHDETEIPLKQVKEKS